MLIMMSTSRPGAVQVQVHESAVFVNIFKQTDKSGPYTSLRGRGHSIDERGCSRPRSALRLQTPPLQRRTHRTPGCAPLKRRRHMALQRARLVRKHPFCALRHSAPTWRGGQLQEHVCRHALPAGAAGLDAADHLLCEVAVCTRCFVTAILRRCHAGTGAVWLRALALSSRPKLGPASPIVAS